MATEARRLRIPFWAALPLYVFCGLGIGFSLGKGYPALAALFLTADVGIFMIRLRGIHEGYFE